MPLSSTGHDESTREWRMVYQQDVVCFRDAYPGPFCVFIVEDNEEILEERGTEGDTGLATSFGILDIGLANRAHRLVVHLVCQLPGSH